MSIAQALIENQSKQTVLDLSREFGVRNGAFKPQTVRESRWAREGMLPIFKFDIFIEANSRSMACG